MVDERRARRVATDQWSRNPAGTTYVDSEEGSAEFFLKMSASRYDLQPWHPALIKAFAPKGRLLEIGSGAGTDHWELAQLAPETVAIDLTAHGAWLTQRRLEQGGFPGRAMVADGEALPFGPEMFDEVYSFGVIMCTDHPESVAAEMYRVMRPGSRFMVALYNRWSLFTVNRVCGWLLQGLVRRQSWRVYLALIEGGADELDEPPVVRLYSRRQAGQLFSAFQNVETSLRHFGIDHGRIRQLFVRRLSAATQERLARRWGWYVVVTGLKPE